MTERMMRSGAVLTTLLFLLCVASSFLYVQLTKALTKTPCCADDAYFSLVAKTFAVNLSYGVPLTSETVSLFDPAISSGPALIIPGAALIALVGAQPWATSLASIFLFVATLTLMIKILTTHFQTPNVFLYSALCLLALVAITPRQDAYYAFLGESPAFGYMMVGCALLATSRGRARSIFLSGLCFSFALLTKHIALFCALGASGSWFLRDLYLYRFYTIRRMGVFLAGVAGPLAAFELVKVIVLGSPGFMAHWHGYLELLSTLHVAPQDRLSEFLAVMNRPYLVSVEAALFALGSLLFTIVITFRRYWLKDDPIFGFMLFAGAIAHLMYILFLSSITARYLWIGMAVMVFAAMSPVLYLRLRFAVPLAVAVIAFVATPTAVLYSYRLQLAGTDGRLQFEREIVMREIAKHPDLPIVSQWWGSIYDVIYLLKDNHPWYITNDEAKVPNLRGLFVTYEPFSPKSYPFYDLVHRSCERLHAELTYYKIFICESNRPASTSPPTRLE